MSKKMMNKEERQKKAMAIRLRGKPSWKQRILSFLYDSGVDGHSETIQKEAGLSIIGKSIKRVSTADGTINEGVQQIRLPFKGLSAKSN